LAATSGGEGPQWSDDGELFYYTADGALWAATLEVSGF
jgi:hypothetical protein